MCKLISADLGTYPDLGNLGEIRPYKCDNSNKVDYSWIFHPFRADGVD